MGCMSSKESTLEKWECADDLNAEVIQVHVVIFHTRDIYRNHWALNLEIAGGRSVYIQFVGGWDVNEAQQFGYVRFKSKSYSYSHKACHHISFPVFKRGVTVNDIAKLMVRRKRDVYKLVRTRHGYEGCRFWVLTIIEDLGKARILPESSYTRTDETMKYFWITATDKKRFPPGSEMVKGPWG